MAYRIYDGGQARGSEPSLAKAKARALKTTRRRSTVSIFKDGEDEASARYKRLKGKYVTEEQYDKAKTKENERLKELRRKQRATARKAQPHTGVGLAPGVSRYDYKKLTGVAPKRTKTSTHVEIASPYIGDALASAPTAKAKASSKPRTARARASSKPNIPDKYYIVASDRIDGRNKRFFNLAKGRMVDNLKFATYAMSPQEANDLIITAQKVYPTLRFGVKKR